MKRAILFLFILVLSSVAGFAQKKFYVTIAGMGFPDAKTHILSGSRDDMLSRPSLAVMPDIGTVVSYQVSYLPKRGEYHGPYEVHGAELTAREKSLTKQGGYGDQFFFEAIKVQLNDGTKPIVDAPAFFVRIQ